MNRFVIAVLSVLVLVSCSKHEKPGKGLMDKYYHVKVDGTALMVRVAGNENSDVALIMTHGGPGGSAQIFRLSKGLQDLEKDFKVIYWDQRGSGMTQGNPPLDKITIEQYAKDLDAVTEFVSQVIGAKSMFLLGHSWGGGLTAFYLTEDLSRQNKFKGYINANGAYNIPGGLHASRQWAINGALLNIAQKKRVDYWKKALQFYDRNTEIVADNFFDHAKYLSDLKGNRWTDPKNEKSYMPAYEMSSFLKNLSFVGKNITYKGNDVYTHLDLTSELSKITLPTLLIWGAKDGLLPPHSVLNNERGTALADDFIKNIGTQQGDLFYSEYPNSAHEPMAEEPGKFTSDLKVFMNKYK